MVIRVCEPQFMESHEYCQHRPIPPLFNNGVQYRNRKLAEFEPGAFAISAYLCPLKWFVTIASASQESFRQSEVRWVERISGFVHKRLMTASYTESCFFRCWNGLARDSRLR